MRKIINLLLTVLVLWVGTTYFHQYIQIDSNQTIIIASLLMVAFDIVYGWFMMASVLTSPILIGCLPLILGVIAIPFLDLIKLQLLSNYLNGFVIHGFWTYVLLVIVLSMFKVKISVNKN
jgi:hypothetical protein